MASPELNEHPTYYTCSNINCPCVKAARRRTGGRCKRDAKGYVIFSNADVKSAGWASEDYPRCSHTECTMPTGPDMGKVLKIAGIATGAAAVLSGLALAVSSLSSSDDSSKYDTFLETTFPRVIAE